MSCCIAVCVRASSAASPRFGADGLSVAQLLGATPVLAPTRAVPLLFEEGYIYIYINIYILFGFIFFFLLFLVFFFWIFFWLNSPYLSYSVVAPLRSHVEKGRGKHHAGQKKPNTQHICPTRRRL